MGVRAVALVRDRQLHSDREDLSIRSARRRVHRGLPIGADVSRGIARQRGEQIVQGRHCRISRITKIAGERDAALGVCAIAERRRGCDAVAVLEVVDRSGRVGDGHITGLKGDRVGLGRADESAGRGVVRAATESRELDRGVL
uniref:Uncharacterized protein n=1 Tax=uncultured marine virus TaxID=186617 RepID=A0A0F7L692_9VIRU|nr:hypothetical protein [uncultured marine virus]